MTEPLPPKILPFDADSFDWDRFEDFCLATVLALPDIRRADRYGVKGDKQDGIDLKAELVDGRLRTYQCRHVAKISPANVRKIIDDTEYGGDEHEIWVTCPVGKAVADVVSEFENWAIESDSGISQLLRVKIPREIAGHIVRDYFGNQIARAFLGRSESYGFISPAEYFGALDDEGRTLRQDIELVGRQDELAGLLDSIDDPKTVLVTLPGRGGIGKTRLLKAAAESLVDQGRRVLVAAGGASLSVELVEDLPPVDLVVILDDAHRLGVDLTGLLQASMRRKASLTILCGCRPGGLEQLDLAAASAGVEPHQVVTLPRLKPLDRDQVVQLASLALGEAGRESERLASATDKLPLLTVLGGRMIAAGAFSSDSASGDEQLRRLVLQRFASEQRGLVSTRIPEQKARELLVLVAAIHPVDVSNDEIVRLWADELSVSPSQVRRWLGDLEDAGLLLSRSSFRRLTPDILADQVLHEACLDPQGRSTGRSEELWDRYAGISLTQLLSNLGELDWRGNDEDLNLLDDAWRRIETTFRNEDAFRREQLIGMIAPAAYYWPESVLRVVDIAMDEPCEPTAWIENETLADHDSVVLKVPRLLQNVARDPELPRPAMDRLWILARTDVRDTNPNPDHPLRILQEIGGYQSSWLHHVALLDLMETQLSLEASSQFPVSPLVLSAPLLAREGMRTVANGFDWQMRSYFVDPSATHELRERIRRVLVEQCLASKPRDRTVAAKLFKDALDLPYGHFGRPVPDDEKNGWKSDQLATLEAIDQVGRETDDPLVRIELVKALQWHAKGGPWEDVTQRADSILAGLDRQEDEIYEAIAHPFDLLEEDDKEARDQRVADALVARFDSGSELADHLNKLMQEMKDRQATDHPEPDAVLKLVFVQDETLTAGFWRWSLEHPDAPGSTSAALAIESQRRSGRKVDSELEAAATSDDPTVRHKAAVYLASGCWFNDPSETELSVLERMAADDYPWVRKSIGLCLARLRQFDPDRAVALSLRVSMKPEEHDGTDHLFATIHEGGLDRLGKDDLELLQERLVELPELGHWAHQVMADLGEHKPEIAISTWKARLQRQDEASLHHYKAVPYSNFAGDLLKGVDGPERLSLLTSLVALAGKVGSWAARQLGSLVWTIAVPDIRDDTASTETLDDRSSQIAAAFEALEECLADQTLTLKDGGRILDQIPWQVVLGVPEWVDRILVFDSDGKGLDSSFRSASMAGIHGRSPGQDSPRWTSTLEQADRSKADQELGERSRELYAAIARIATKEIEGDRKQDEDEQADWE